MQRYEKLLKKNRFLKNKTCVTVLSNITFYLSDLLMSFVCRTLFILLIALSSNAETQLIEKTSSWWPFQASTPTTPAKETKSLSVLGNLVGRFPRELERLSFIFSEGLNDSVALMLNRLILYGPPGNGKTSIARILGNTTRYNFFEYKGSTLVTKYVGSGAQKIEEIFDIAIRTAEYTGKTSIIFIDELEQIAATNTSEFRSEHDAALRTLWLNLDKYKDNHHIYFIGATNNFKSLHPTLIDRFGSNLIEIKNPDKEMRKKLLEYYFKRVDVELAPSLVSYLAKKTNHMSARSIEDMVRSVKLIAMHEYEGVICQELILDEITRIKARNTLLNRMYDYATDEDALRHISYGVAITGSLASLMFYGINIFKSLKQAPKIT